MASQLLTRQQRTSTHAPERERVRPAPSRSRPSVAAFAVPFVQRKPTCPCGGGCPRCEERDLVQAKLRIGQPGDRYEQEADRVAERVMRMPEPAGSPGVSGRAPVEGIQRCEDGESCGPCADGECSREDEEEERALLQRQPMEEEEEEEEETLRAKAVAGHAPEVTPDVQAEINAVRGGGRPLPQSERAFFEPRLGYNFGGVRVHTDARAAESARAVSARSFTVGRDIVFAPGQYAPGTAAGRRLLAHELTHVAQQEGWAETVRRSPADARACPRYEPSEVDTSRTARGHLEPDVTLHAPGRLLLADFGVGWRGVKRSTQNEPLLNSWLNVFESDDSYRLSITGYADCSGSDRRNTRLRHGRAERVERLLGTTARSRVTFRGMAALRQYVTDNTTAANRAKNRGVIIGFSRELVFPPERITVPRPAPPPAPTTAGAVDCTPTQASELRRAHPIAIAMVRKALGLVGGRITPERSALLRKYFNDASVSTEIHVGAGLRRVLSGLRSSFKFECERRGSFMYSYFCGGKYAYVRPFVGFRVHMCEPAFGRSDTALAETIIHECSHMFDFTGDETACWGGCPSSLSRWDAYDNAASFSKFAWEAYTTLP